jgi:sugar phosphate isomerase/epimerase
MSRIGADVKFQDGRSRLAGTPRMTLDTLSRLDLDGILVRTLDEAFPTLDVIEISAFARAADALGMFVRMGIGKINPYMTAELPRVRVLGDGSYLAGMQRMIRLCGSHGWTEVWTAVGGFKPGLPAPFCFDRFRTDVSWQAQLEATSAFIAKLEPTLRAEGVRLNIETHEEITTTELLALVRAHGEDIVGVCLDPANLPVRGETVLDGTRRVAPYVHLTHLRDLVLARTEEGLSRFLMPIGDGQIEWTALLGLLAGRDDVDLLIEAVGGTRAEMALRPDDPFWRAAHPDLDDGEIGELERLADRQARDAVAGTAPDIAALRANGDPDATYRAFLERSLASLRRLLHTMPAPAPRH